MNASSELKRLRAELATASHHFSLSLEWEEELDSTSNALLRRADELASRTVLLANRQTAGRGRRGQPWQTPPGGNLALSVFARLAMPPAALGGLSLALGVACAEALRRLGATTVTLKWPNDLQVADRKLGGLLVELARTSTAHSQAVIGLGLNLHLPSDADPAWIGLRDVGVGVDRVVVAARVIDALLTALDDFERAGFSAFAERWRQLDGLHGRPVRVLAADAEHHGTVLGVRMDGALLLHCSDGERAFVSADVSLRPS